MNLDDLLTECAKVLLFSFARNRGEKKDYRGELCCSGEPPKKEKEECHCEDRAKRRHKRRSSQ